VICSESIENENERQNVLDSLGKSGRKIVEIDLQQMNSFSGNVLQLKNENGTKVLVISETSFKTLNEKQKSVLNETNDHLAVISIPTIEKHGGGSVRCCLCEIFY